MAGGCSNRGGNGSQWKDCVFLWLEKNTVDQVKYKLDVCLVHSSVDWESSVRRPYLVKTSLLRHGMEGTILTPGQQC